MGVLWKARRAAKKGTEMQFLKKAQFTWEAKNCSTLEFPKEAIRCHQSVNNSLGIYKQYLDRK